MVKAAPKLLEALKAVREHGLSVGDLVTIVKAAIVCGIGDSIGRAA